MALDKKGHEVLDDTPVSIPLKFRRIENLTDQIKRVVASEFSRQAEASGYGSFEDEDDFDIGDDYDPRSRYELDEEQENAGRNEGSRGGTPPAEPKGTSSEEGEIQSGGEGTEEPTVSDKRVLPDHSAEPGPKSAAKKGKVK